MVRNHAGEASCEEHGDRTNPEHAEALMRGSLLQKCPIMLELAVSVLHIDVVSNSEHEADILITERRQAKIVLPNKSRSSVLPLRQRATL
jgi:hypothetical protein